MNQFFKFLFVLNILAIGTQSHGQINKLETLFSTSPNENDQELVSVYEFMTAQEANIVCTGNEIRSNLTIGAVILGIVSGDVLVTKRTQHLIKKFTGKSTSLRKLGWAGAGLSVVLIGAAQSIESDSLGEWWESFWGANTIDSWVIDPIADPAGVDSDLKGAILHSPKTYMNFFLTLTPEHAEKILVGDEQLQQITIRYSRVLEAKRAELLGSDFIDQYEVCSDLENKLSAIQEQVAQEFLENQGR